MVVRKSDLFRSDRMFRISIDIQQFLHPKLVLSMLIWILVYTIMGVLGGSVAQYHFPRVFPGTNYPEKPLPDFGHDLVPYFCFTLWGKNPQTVVLLLFYAICVVGALCTPRNKGRIMVQQFLHLHVIMFLMRTTTVSITGLPTPNPNCIKVQSIETTYIKSLEYVMLDHFPPNACGDSIFSGHVSSALISMVIFQKYHFLEGPIAYALIWMLSLVNIFSVISCRTNYSVDVVIAFFFIYFIQDWYFCRSEIGRKYMQNNDEYLTKIKQSSLTKLIVWLEGDDAEEKNENLT